MAAADDAAAALTTTSRRRRLRRLHWFPERRPYRRESREHAGGDMRNTPRGSYTTISAAARGSVTAQFPAGVRGLWVATERTDFVLTSALCGKPALPKTAGFSVILDVFELSVPVLALLVAKLAYVSVAARLVKIKRLLGRRRVARTVNVRFIVWPRKWPTHHDEDEFFFFFFCLFFAFCFGKLGK